MDTKGNLLFSRLNSRYSPVFLALLACWGFINLAQGWLTEIHYDEAYYWMYSRHLDWGFFDHPPMIALFIKAGSLLFSGTLGVRFVTVIAQLITLCLLWDLIGDKSADNRKILTFFGIAASVVMFQVYGFLATPDSPLLLSTAVFLLGYKRFLVKESWPSILLLGVSMAALVYSKYHGVLLIFLIMASNPGLLRSRGFWIAGLIGLTLFIPHMAWQFQHDFPSLRYHLITRSTAFNIKNSINFFPNQLSSFNPFFLGLVIALLLKTKPNDTFERGLYFIITGILTFFFISSIRGHVEPHWTIAASIPMIILVYRNCIDHPGRMKYLQFALFPTILILGFLRIALIVDILPINLKFHGQEKWYNRLSALAGNTPVVFNNSYKQPSVYAFYTGKPATTLNSIFYRRNQYDLWPYEESFFGKEALLVTNVNDPKAGRYDFPNGKKVYLHYTDHFFAVQQIQVKYDLQPSVKMKPGEVITLKAEIFNPYAYPIDFNDTGFPVTVNALFLKDQKNITITPVVVTPALTELSPHQKQSLDIVVEVPDLCPGKYKFGISLKAGIIEEAFNSIPTSVLIVE
ncbi:MAG TPA: glycosyltransferase family 39 protein [Saprospiraceae bacterium]|nr:glycosyltransferase family 39 protein [Saprospiraceae bacterium]